MDFFIEITDKIRIYNNEFLFLYATFKGNNNPTITYFDANEEMVFQIKRHNYGLKRKAEVLYKKMTFGSIRISRNGLLRSEMEWGNNRLSYSVLYFKKKKICFGLNGQTIGYAEHAKLIQSGGKIVYKIFLDSNDEIMNKLILIFFTGTFIQFFI